MSPEWSNGHDRMHIFARQSSICSPRSNVFLLFVTPSFVHQDVMFSYHCSVAAICTPRGNVFLPLQCGGFPGSRFSDQIDILGPVSLGHLGWQHLMDFDQPDYEEEHGGDHGDMEDVASNVDIVQRMTRPKDFVDALDVVGHLEGDIDCLFQLRTMGPLTR